jgi:tripartite-type tricarboxylate transporter receptor subunit TctC
MFLRVLCALALLAFPVQAQDWPTKPVKLVTPFPTGGSVDGIARIVAAQLKNQLGQPVDVENMTGAGALTGAEFVARATPDGYTLLVTSAALANSPLLYGRNAYDWQKDFDFITSISVQPLVLLVKPTMPARTMTAFIAQARKDNGRMVMGTSGEGLIAHLAGLLLEQRAGVRFEAAHYRSGAPAMIDLMSDQTQFQFEPISTALPMIRDGRLRALAVTSLMRSPALPDVPTVAETLPGFEAINLLGLAGPANLPDPVEGKISAAVKSLLEDPIVLRRFEGLGTEARFLLPEDFQALMRRQAELWATVIRKANLKLE